MQDGAQVPAVVAVAFGLREQPGVPVAEVLARVLVRRQQQLLLVLVPGNCEHVIGAAAALCGRLLQACDDVRVLATSWEPLRIAGRRRTGWRRCRCPIRMMPVAWPGRRRSRCSATGPAP